jgi:hypothetical protein
LSAFLVLIKEVLLDDVVGLYVNLLVGVGPALVNLLDTAALINQQGVAVGGVSCVTGSLLV